MSTLSAATVLTGPDGIASVRFWLPTKAGTETLVATAAGYHATFIAEAEAGPIAGIAAISGNGQAAVSGTVLPKPLEVVVSDQFGNPVAEALVTFRVLTGGGSVESNSGLSGADGRAAAGRWTLGPEPGIQQVMAHTGDFHVVFQAEAHEACKPTICQQILFVRDGDIYSYDFGTTATRQLTSGGRSGQPAWSPDGQRIAFARRGANAMLVDVYVMDADGSHVAQRTSGTPFQLPAWSPDGNSLALVGDWWSCVYDCSVYTLDLAGPDERPRRIAGMGTDPDWSPDGKKIVFVSLSGDDGYHALHVMNADGTAITTVLPRDEGAINRPTWSPDGSRIAFSKCLDGCDIYTVNPDGSDLTRLTNVRNAFQPSWSPDGSRIAFTRSSLSAGSSIEYIEPGGSPVPLLPRASSPAWRR